MAKTSVLIERTGRGISARPVSGRVVVASGEKSGGSVRLSGAVALEESDNTEPEKN